MAAGILPTPPISRHGLSALDRGWLWLYLRVPGLRWRLVQAVAGSRSGGADGWDGEGGGDGVRWSRKRIDGRLLGSLRTGTRVGLLTIDVYVGPRKNIERDRGS